MTGSTLPGWGPLLIHLTADTSWVSALGQVSVSDHQGQEAWPPHLSGPGQQGVGEKCCVF